MISEFHAHNGYTWAAPLNATGEGTSGGGYSMSPGQSEEIYRVE